MVNWAGFARIIRAEAISLREREFVEAARALGVRDLRIVARHVIPNTLASTLVMSSYYIAYTVIAEAEGWPYSPTLHAVANGYTLPPGTSQREERLVFLVQRLLNVGLEEVLADSGGAE